MQMWLQVVGNSPIMHPGCVPRSQPHFRALQDVRGKKKKKQNKRVEHVEGCVAKSSGSWGPCAAFVVTLHDFLC